ncbi:MAG: TIGR04211 family SH3 domain-containing protein [Paraglaciecola sp.]|uniref:TIGR04211 family SH3 domain-containing protein n=1 Tax=Paraglaciecola sp. TaxID=1920173 RepID=UPI00273D2325|nr:TIGR04211 family SH3 domain-containing protein [Paraglaciecola sp.]MDP5033001.1 TIGR04211 family SH3 domain-containing protein [Paraglaciecola sp.]MDP5039519.1 TIGR04211 family SH3 domain-containing protein [Paraglaciecola sp.]MDP5133630.1 TIGR04211 family SH3 domain-containing protein [Paraglaciecola sp.]
MRQQLVLFFIMLSVSFFGNFVSAQEPNDSEGEVRYISDDLFTFLHAGPGRNYRILGSVVAGSRVIMLQQDRDNGFIEIIDDKQRTGWVDAEFINKTPSVREQIPSLQQNLQDANAALKQQRTDNDLLNQQIADLQSQNTTLARKLTEIESQNEQMSIELADQDQTAQIEWFTRGGIVAVISLILGIVITYLPKKRRRNDNWM